MSQATYANTTSDELLCRARDLQSALFDGCRLGIVRMADSFVIRDWSVIDALRLTRDDEIEAAFRHLAPEDAKSVIVRGRGSEEREVGCYVSATGAMRMALAQPSASLPGSAAHSFLLWLARQAAAQQQPKRGSSTSARTPRTNVLSAQA